MSLIRLTLVAAAIAALPLAAGAATKVYSFNLDGMQEVPPVATPAAGSAQVTVDDVAGTITFALAAFNLQGDFAAAHIHQAPAGVNGPVVFNLAANADAQGAVTIGSFVVPNSYALYGADKASSFAAAINAAPWNFYLNLHTQAFPGGEIRGQLAPIPEPSAAILLLAGLVLVAGAAQRRRLST